MEGKIMLNKLKAFPHEIIFAISIFIMMSGIMTGTLFILIFGVLLTIIAIIKRHTDQDSL
jgi:hypothetical protein